MSQLHRILYCSRNRLAGSPGEVADEIRGILAISRVNNARDQITGGLLFSDGCFAQVLEGPLTMVEQAFERIQCDDRHGELTVLQSAPVAARDFPEWSMAFTGSTAADPIAGMTLSAAFSGRSAAGEDILKIMRGVVVREDRWLEPASAI